MAKISDEMGKRIISRARGKGGPRYRAPSHRFAGTVSYPQIKETVQAKVIDIVHDPGRDAPLAKIQLPDKREKFMIAVEGMKVGDKITISGVQKGVPVFPGNVAPLSAAQEGTAVCSIEASPQSGPKYCRSPGTYATVVSKGEKIVLKMPSGEFKEFDPRCFATAGVPAGSGREDKPFVKAGQVYYAALARNRLWPRSSGVKMNPVDHPFGGKTKPGWPKTVSRHAPPGQKVGSLAARRTGKRKK